MSMPELKDYLCDAAEIQHRVEQIDPRAYDKTRNYLNGQVTWLSPFITHGITNTSRIAATVLESHKPKSCYRFLFELGWREFFHRTWQLAESDIFDDMRHAQEGVKSEAMPAAIVNASTQIDTLDRCIESLVDNGLMHNHARMWVAGISCNILGTYWQEPARWLHYHLLDGDLASNTLSWQWIAGTFSHKQYLANQSNIDKYSKHKQPDTWLDVPYEAFDSFTPPPAMLERCSPDLSYELPGTPVTELAENGLQGKVALRCLWQLDPEWQSDIEQHVLFIDTALAERWPMSPKRWQFIAHWAEHCNARILHGTVKELTAACKQADAVRTEYPACNDWPGKVLERNWLYPMPDGPFNSFSQYFKQVKHHAGL